MANMWEMDQRRRYSMAAAEQQIGGLPPPSCGMLPSTSEDLHAWSIYRQNLNSDFTDSALGSNEKSPLPYGNFQLRESTVQSILNHPRYGPKSALGSNMYTYLKFGLPRVFPPNGRKENSSGYNSSDEGGSKRRKNSNSYLKAKSEADLINMQFQPGVTPVRGKSISQANLLSPDFLMKREQATHRRSLHDLRHSQFNQTNGGRPASVAMPNHHPTNYHPGNHQHIRSASALSTVVPTSGSIIHPRAPSTEPPFSFSMLHPQQYTGLYPHLQIRNLNLKQKNSEPLINNLSIEVKAGEIMAIMATNGHVATALLEVIAGLRKYNGHISLNGQSVRGRDLRKIVAYVRSKTVLPPDLAVHNCLRFYAKLRYPPESRGKLPMEEQVRIVTEELGLSPVLGTKVSDLTRSEYNRLLVAVQLLTDCRILCIDYITHAMDIFDTFFLIEFLRQWASGATGGVTGRIVVIALQPPTYEILTMVSRLVLLSGCDPMYHGLSRHLTSYFTSTDYPCPVYKNPADYYLDLVTLDDLSAEAMLESSQRVDQLSALYKRRLSPLTDNQVHIALPAKFRFASIPAQIYSLFLKEMIYSQPSAFCSWILKVLISILISVIIGVIFWDVPATDPQLIREDRLGYHFAILGIGSWPLLLTLSLTKCCGIERKSTESDINQGLYSRFTYILCSLIFTFIPSLLIWLAYLIPAISMSGLSESFNDENIGIYLFYAALCLISTQYSLMCMSYFMSVLIGGESSQTCSVILSLIIGASIAGTGTGWAIFSTDNIEIISSFASLTTPSTWIYPKLIERDYSRSTLTALNKHLVCRNKQIQHQDIIVQLPCPVPNGTSILHNRGLSSPQNLSFLASFIKAFTSNAAIPPILILLFSCLLTIIIFSCSNIFKNHNGKKFR